MKTEATPFSELKSTTAILILAAGSSSRMGTSKQLLELDDTVLLRKSVITAIATGVARVCVVLGSDESAHRKTIQDLKVEITFNPNWANGIGSSLKHGIHVVMAEDQKLEAMIVMVCDQPLLTTHHLNSLIEQRIAKRTPIVASSYASVYGVPALFSKSYFAALGQLSDQHGAKRIIDQNMQDVSSVIFAGGEIDLDTIEDYRKFLSTKLKQ